MSGQERLSKIFLCRQIYGMAEAICWIMRFICERPSVLFWDFLILYPWAFSILISLRSSSYFSCSCLLFSLFSFIFCFSPPPSFYFCFLFLRLLLLSLFFSPALPPLFCFVVFLSPSFYSSFTFSSLSSSPPASLYIRPTTSFFSILKNNSYSLHFLLIKSC